MNLVRSSLPVVIWMSCIESSNRGLIWMRSPVSLTCLLIRLLTALMHLMCSFRDKTIHWDHDYQYCEFPRESNTLYQAPSYASSTSNHVHYGQSLQQYVEEDRIHCEYVGATKHFEYQEWCKTIPSEREFAVHGSAPVNIVSWGSTIH